MKAITFDQFGGPEVLSLSELPQPVPGAGDVLVKVAATTANPTDVMMRNGMQAKMMEHLTPPYIAGMEFSGTILDPGTSDFKNGQPVIGVINPRTPGGGSYAEVIAVSAKSVAAVAPEVDLVSAATVPMNALTAEMSLEFLGLKSGQTLLVTGGAGMLGGSAIQLAKAASLTVLANVGAKDTELAKSLGADHILPRDEGLEDAVRAICPDGVDGMIDGALIGQETSKFVRDDGGIVSLRSSYKIEDPRLRIFNVGVLNGLEKTSTLQKIAGLIASGGLVARVAKDGIYKYSDASDAHIDTETGGKRGRVVIAFDA